MYSLGNGGRSQPPAEHAAEQLIEVVRRDLGLPEIAVMLCYPPHEPAAAHTTAAP